MFCDSRDFTALAVASAISDSFFFSTNCFHAKCAINCKEIRRENPYQNPIKGRRPKPPIPAMLKSIIKDLHIRKNGLSDI
tara:strand:- start:16797 stop:17036 length:240 start_codon:yes stop_codon:yes gene_type:complete